MSDISQYEDNPELEEFDTVRLKRRVKLSLEEIQERVKMTERMRKRPPLSDIVSRLIEIAEEAAQSGAQRDPQKPAETKPASLVGEYREANVYAHDLLEVILEGDNVDMREAILKNLRAFALTTLVAEKKSEDQVDRDLKALIRHQRQKREQQLRQDQKKSLTSLTRPA